MTLDTTRRGFLGGLAATLLVSTTGVKLAVPQTKPLLAANGWPICNGQKLLRAEYPELFQVLGTLYGGDDERFALPQIGGSAGMTAVSLTRGAFGQMVAAVAPRSMPSMEPALHLRSMPVIFDHIVAGQVQMMFLGGDA